MEQKNQILINIDDIKPNKEQPRKHFDKDSLVELSESIKQYGILSPILVQRKKDWYEIIAGERRYRAAKLAKLDTIPVVLLEENRQKLLEISIIENIQREDLNPIEIAQSYKKLMFEFHLTQEQIAKRIGVSRPAVTNVLRLLKLDKRVQQFIIDEKLSEGHGRLLLEIKEDDDYQYEYAKK